MGAFSALLVLLALTSTGASAETEVPAEPTPTVTPTESPLPEPTPTASPSPTPSPSTRPTPAPSPTKNTPPESDPDDDEESDDESNEDDSDDEESDDEAPDDDPVPSEPGEPTTGTPTTGAPVGFDPKTGDLKLQPYIASSLVFAAEDEYNPLEADFEFIVTPRSLTVEFYDDSECGSEGECDIDYWSWRFGDGRGSSEQNPTHTYANPGTYTVSLTVKYVEFPRFADRVAAAEGEGPSCGEHDDEGGFFIVYCDTVTYPVTVTGLPNADFTADPTSGLAPLTVEFENKSTGDIHSKSWSFSGPACGNASAGPAADKFNETFMTEGACTVTLRVNAPPAPTPGPSFAPRAAKFDPNCNCSTTSKTITVIKQDDDNDDDSDDGDDSDDSDDDDGPSGVFIPRNPPLNGQPTPEPTDPSPSPGPTSRPITPITPIAPTETVDPEPAGWVTGAGASGAGLALMILAAVIGSMRGLSMAGRRVALVADRDENTIQRHVAARDAEGWGDRSFTWRFPGHRLIDAASVVVPDRLFRFSPLVGRITEDGSEFRAMFGSLWLATPLAGIALGIASAAAAGGRALPPSVWLVAAGAVLATFDAFSGAVAVVLFAGAAFLGGLGGAQGGPDTVHSLLVILAIGFLWMAIPLIGSAIRPFRRLGDGSLLHRWNVLGDGLIAALLCGWVAQKLTQAMDLFAGQKTGLPEHANTVAVVVMAAVALRVTMEHFTMSAYPRRLQQVEGEDPPSPFLASVVLGAFVRTAVFGFIGYAFIGSCWQLWLGIGLFLIPQLIDHLRERFRNIGAVQRILPRGVVEIFILVVTCTLIARYAMNQTPDEFTGLKLAFLLIAIPPALLGILRVFAEDPDDSGDTSWIRQFLGAIIVAVTAVLAARGWDY